MILSNVELYFSPVKNINENKIIISGDEFYHIVNVMRHKIDDIIYVTSGNGIIYKSKVAAVEKQHVIVDSIKNWEDINKLSNITFCLPQLKSRDRFEFALEKCVELGITNFVIFNAERSIKRKPKIERWKKILLSAMKQSLRAFLPTIKFVDDLKNLNPLYDENHYIENFHESTKIIFEQNAEISFKNYLLNNFLQKQIKRKKLIFIFGPGGGLTKKELEQFNNKIIVKLSDKRLRSETAVVTSAAIISSFFTED